MGIVIRSPIVEFRLRVAVQTHRPRLFKLLNETKPTSSACVVQARSPKSEINQKSNDTTMLANVTSRIVPKNISTKVRGTCSSLVA
jgi:hypothetical protein